MERREIQMDQNGNTNGKLGGFEARPPEMVPSLPDALPPQTGPKAKRFKDPSRLTKILRLFLYLSIGVSAIAIWSDYLERGFLKRVDEGYYSSEEAATVDADASDARQAIVALVTIPVNITTLILFFVWVYRASFNVRQLGAEGLQFSPAWSVGWYFVPVGNLWKPYQSMHEIFRASENPTDWANQPQSTRPIVAGWWILWILSGILAKASLRMSLGAEEIHELLNVNMMSIIAEIVDIPSSVLTLILVGTIFRMQTSAPATLPQPAPLSDTELLTVRNE
jgi:hypothetical protein